MQNFSYQAPSSLPELLKLRAETPDSALLAGGTDLIVKMRGKRNSAGLVLDTKQVPELMEIEFCNSELRIGASVSCWRIYRDPEITKLFPCLEDSARLIGGTAIQGRASFGGNLCNAAPSGDAIPSLIALNAKAHIAGPNGNRTLQVEELCTGPGKNCLQTGEVLVSLTLPLPKSHSGARFLRFIPRNEMDIAVASAAAHVDLKPLGETFRSARVAVGSVAPTPLYLPEVGEFLHGQSISEGVIGQAAEIASSLVRPISDMRGSASQRIQLVKVLVQRAVADAVARAQEVSK